MRHHRLSLFSLVATILLLSCFTSCKNKVMYANNHSFPHTNWNLNDTVHFAFEVDDTINPYSFYLNIRNNNDYPRSRLYLFVDSEIPGNISGKDTLEIILAEADGKWIGKGFGDIKENEIMIRDQFRFHNKGSYKFNFVHGMRLDSLAGIESIGIRIESSK